MNGTSSVIDHSRPTLVGLTGSIGMGKSTVAGMLRDLAVPVFDADAEVHRLQQPGSAIFPLIEHEFPGTTGPAGLDRDRLGALVFGDERAIRRLEKIIHPAVAEAQAMFMARHHHEPIVVLDIPLLFEKGGHTAVDRIIVVSAPPEEQRRRVLARPGMTVEKFDAILARQVPDQEKRALADYVVDTSASLDDTRAQVVGVIACLRSERRA